MQFLSMNKFYDRGLRYDSNLWISLLLVTTLTMSLQHAKFLETVSFTHYINKNMRLSTIESKVTFQFILTECFSWALNAINYFSWQKMHFTFLYYLSHYLLKSDNWHFCNLGEIIWMLQLYFIFVFLVYWPCV